MAKAKGVTQKEVVALVRIIKRCDVVTPRCKLCEAAVYRLLERDLALRAEGGNDGR